MKQRCLNPAIKAYRRYGGRGITIYEPWIHDANAFLDYMGPKPTPQHSLDRFPNKDGNYEPNNVRWATKAEQARNNNNAKLTEAQVALIRQCLENGGVGRHLAKAFQVSDATISEIKTRQTWEDV